jgi:hypothetical protein
VVTVVTEQECRKKEKTMVARRVPRYRYTIETFDFIVRRLRVLGTPDTASVPSQTIDLDAMQADRTQTTVSPEAPVSPLAAGMYDQELSAAAAEQMEQVLQHRIGQPTRPASDLPHGDLSMLLRRRR